jgi:hypothetical protein
MVEERKGVIISSPARTPSVMRSAGFGADVEHFLSR